MKKDKKIYEKKNKKYMKKKYIKKIKNIWKNI
jgi:hypothetical protein